MPTHFIGTTFGQNSQWYVDEVKALQRIKNQIDEKFSESENLMINTTWFGPQFNNGEYDKLNNFSKIDNLFFVTLVDEIMLTRQQIEDIRARFNAEIYLIGNYQSPYEISFIASVLPKYFKIYSESELLLKEIKYLYLCYNRKPREHRVNLVNRLVSNGFDKLGIVTLGINDIIYSKTESAPHFLLNEEPGDYAKEGNWDLPMNFGIPHDIHSLGNMDIWQSSFLNIVGETAFNPWEPIFVTEKTWKPIIGLRPFLINGNTKTYKWLRDNGFKTFNHYFDVQIENLPEYETHNSIIKVIESLINLDPTQILQIYNDMLPDLQYNKERFFEFSKEQQTLIDNILCQNSPTKH